MRNLIQTLLLRLFEYAGIEPFGYYDLTDNDLIRHGDFNFLWNQTAINQDALEQRLAAPAPTPPKGKEGPKAATEGKPAHYCHTVYDGRTGYQNHELVKEAPVENWQFMHGALVGSGTDEGLLAFLGYRIEGNNLVSVSEGSTKKETTLPDTVTISQDVYDGSICIRVKAPKEDK